MTVPATEAPPAPAAETPPPAPAPPAAPAPAPPAPVPAPPSQPREPDGRFAPAQAAPPAQQAAAADVTDWRAEAERLRGEADEARRQADQWKAQSRRQEQRSKLNHQELQNRDALLREIAAKVGVEFDDHPDPEVLQQRLTEQTALARQRAVELAVYTQAAQAGQVNAGALLDSREFMSRTAALDPEAGDFHSQLADLVREAAGQPRYQFQQPPAPPAPEPPSAPSPPPVQQQPPQPPAPASGADFSGAPKDDFYWTQADYDYWVKNDRDGGIVTKAIAEGRLERLGIGRAKQRARR